MTNKATRNERNQNLKERIHNVIPGGAHTYSRGDDQFPESAPAILERGKGAWVWDTDDNKYLDYGMALRAVTLGYANDRVNQAAIREIEKGNNLTRASSIELEAAEAFVNQIPSAEMVKFGKNGSNVTTAAVKIARAYTGKKYVCIPRQHPFFSFDDWFIGTTPIKKGTLSQAYESTLVFDYGNEKSLADLFDKYPGQIAAVLMEPATAITPCEYNCGNCFQRNNGSCKQNGNHFLNVVRDLCTRNNTVFILDEMITGFRWHNGGAQTFFGVEPDLSTFGKGMANGFSIAAVVGKRELMEVGSIQNNGAERTFLLSTTHGGEMCSLGALLETIKIYNEENVVDHLWGTGEALKNMFNRISQSKGLLEYVSMDGPAISLNYLTKNKGGEVDLSFRTLFAQEMLKNGVMMPWIAQSFAHGDEELSFTEQALEKSLDVYAKALENGVQNYLEGQAIKPVFRVRN